MIKVLLLLENKRTKTPVHMIYDRGVVWFFFAMWDLLLYTKAIILFIICTHGVQLTWISGRT